MAGRGGFSAGLGFSAAGGAAALSDPGGIAGATYGLGGCDGRGDTTDAPGGGVGAADLDTGTEGVTGDDAGALTIAGADGLSVIAGAGADDEED